MLQDYIINHFDDVSFIIKDGFAAKIVSIVTLVNVVIYIEIGDFPFKMFFIGALIFLLVNRFVLETKRILK